jgi:GTP-binding protein
MKIHSAEFICSNSDYRKCPESHKPEFAFIGRSNVGKSSLINALVQRKDLAKTSSQPGKTRLINHFLINDQWYLVDLPGYGYAKVARTEREKWQRMIDGYLLNRINLLCTFVLIDVRLEPQKNDIQFINYLGEKQIPFAIVFTKADKPTKNELNQRVSVFRKELLKWWESLPEDFITSSSDGTGIDKLRDYLDQCMAGSK